MIIKMIKYFIRNACSPYLKTVTSHSIKSVIMHMVLEDDIDFENGNLEETFQICFKELEKKVCDGIIQDIIFPNVNLLRSKKASVDARYIKHLGDLLRNPENSQEDVYHEMNWTCMFCYETTLVQGMLPMEYHAAEKHHLVILGMY